jgi:hypothetical protein
LRTALVIEYDSPRVQTANLIDLPGIVSVHRAGEGEDVTHTTRELTQHWIADEHTIVVCVVSGDVRNNIAVQCLQKIPGALARTIVVMAKADTLVDTAFAQKQKKNCLWQLKESCHPDAIAGFQGTIVPVRNRDTEIHEQKSIEQVNKDELKWFQTLMPTRDTERQVSVRAVINAIDGKYTQHMRDVWIPTTMEHLHALLERLHDEMHKLGGLPSSLARPELCAHFTQAVASKLARLLEEQFNEPTSAALHADPAHVLFPYNKCAESEFLHYQQALMEQRAAAATLLIYNLALDQTFSTDTTLPYNIARFSHLRKALKKDTLALLARLTSVFTTRMANYLAQYESNQLAQPPVPVQETLQRLATAELHGFQVYLLGPFTEKLPATMRQTFATAPLVEDCASERREFISTIASIDGCLATLKSLR